MLRQRDPRKHDEPYLNFIRSLECACCGNDIETQAAHVKYAEPRAGKYKAGLAKSHDCFAVPLCGRCHLGPAGQHSTNEQQWWQELGIDPVYLALALWRVWTFGGDHAAATEIIRAHRDLAVVTTD